MDESAKRRERLKAMRMEASQAAVCNDAEHSMVSDVLSNPLVETTETQPVQVESFTPQRFDYYTDPMAAFSGNKRRSKDNHQISLEYFTPPTGPRNTESTPSPVIQAQINYSSDQRMYRAQVHYHSSGSHRNAVGMASPYGTQPGSPGVWNNVGGTSSYCFPSNSPRGGNYPSPGLGQGVSPIFNSGQGRGHSFSNSPGPGSGRGGSPGFKQGGSPSFNSGRGRGHWFSNSPGSVSGRGGSPGPNSGRGRGPWLGNNMSPGSGRSGGRGKGSHNHVSAELRPDLYYKKSMVEDPWKFCKPVVWRENFPVTSLKTPDSLKSWLPKSISTKRARESVASRESSSQPSLAEYLAASFNEAVNDEPSV